MKLIIFENSGKCSVLMPAYHDATAQLIADRVGILLSGDDDSAELVQDDLMARIKSLMQDIDLTESHAEITREVILRLQLRYVPEGAPFRVIDDTEFAEQLSDREFRDAWRFCDKQGIRVDLDAAKEIHKDRIRVKRKPLLEALDVDYIRALESGDSAASTRIVKRKQQLRDLTAAPEIANAKTVDELRQFKPLG